MSKGMWYNDQPNLGHVPIAVAKIGVEGKERREGTNITGSHRTMWNMRGVSPKSGADYEREMEKIVGCTKTLTKQYRNQQRAIRNC